MIVTIIIIIVLQLIKSEDSRLRLLSPPLLKNEKREIIREKKASFVLVEQKFKNIENKIVIIKYRSHFFIRHYQNRADRNFFLSKTRKQAILFPS